MTTAAGDKYANFAAKAIGGLRREAVLCVDSFLVFVFDTLITISAEILVSFGPVAKVQIAFKSHQPMGRRP